MPYTEQGLPFASGITPQSQHTSRAGAEDAAGRALPQTIRYLRCLKDHGGLTDLEAAKLLGLERSSINARRVPLMKAGIVVSCGFRKGPTGVKNCVWKVAP